MDSSGFGKAFDGIVAMAYIGIATVAVATFAIPIGLVWGAFWVWNHVSVH